MNIDTIKFCRICNSKNIQTFFDLGSQPFANSLLNSADEKENLYPLSLSYCQNCSLAQLDETADPKELFSNYVWVTGTSKSTQDFAQTFYKELIKRADKSISYVLEIASNDGTFLLPFTRNGYKVLGIDPAENIVEMAQKNGINTKCAFWDAKTSRAILKEQGPAPVVFARNVLMHVANIRDFIEGLSIILDESGTLAIETHYAKTILEELHYDYIYHEHLCYFTLKTLEKLLNDFGLYIFDVIESPISGGGIIVYIKKQKTGEEPIVQKYKDYETQNKINDFATWENFAKNSFLHKEKLLEILNCITAKNEAIMGYGASARSSTMLNFCGIDYKIIDVIADKNSLKQGKFTAGTHIPIVSPEEMMKRNPKHILILAWNFKDEIINYLESEFGYAGDYIIPLPNIPRIQKSRLT